jgi:hypothetical protein
MGYIWLPLPLCGLLATYDLRLAAWMPYFLIFQAAVPYRIVPGGAPLV